MAGYLAAEHLNSDGEPDVPKKSRSTGMRRPRRRVAKKVRLEVEDDNEGGSHDNEFMSISSDSQSSESSSGDDELLTNAEVRKLHLYYTCRGADTLFYPACRYSSFQDGP
jgi:hypothetical protein